MPAHSRRSVLCCEPGADCICDGHPLCKVLQGNFISTSSIQIGKYRVTPLTKRLSNDRYAASVSIRSGNGSNTHDRVMRLVPSFHSDQDAATFALHEGVSWVHKQNHLFTGRTA